LLNYLREPVGKYLKLTPLQIWEMDYKYLFLYCDVIIARKFEGLPELGHLTKKQLLAVKDVNKWLQLN
jgi:hypothetical protein